MKTRLQVNQEVRAYWKWYKKNLLVRKPCIKRKVPAFTRHNGLKIRRLMDSGWRHPRSTQGNRATITKPVIGYKNPQSIRYCISAYGLRPLPVSNEKQIDRAVKEGYLPILRHDLGARSRARVLSYAQDKSYPLAFFR